MTAQNPSSTAIPRRPARTSSRVPIIAGAAGIVVVLGIAAALHFRSKGTDATDEADGHDRAAPLPYVNYAPVRKDQRGKAGTTVYDKAKASPGYNLYIQKPDSGAILVDMQGEVVHRWASSEGQPPSPLERWRGWRVARMTPKGELYAAIDHAGLIKLDWDSKLLWRSDAASHHEIVIGDEGDVYAMTAELRLVQIGGRDRAIEDDVIAVFSADGKPKDKISLYDVFAADKGLEKSLEDLTSRRFARVDRNGVGGGGKKQRYPAEQIQALLRAGKVEGLSAYENFKLSRAVPGGAGDVFHANALVLLKAHPSGLWKDGDMLVSCRYLNLLVVFDPRTKKVAWTWGPGEVFGQHEPSILPNGNVLVYDNGTWRPGAPADPEEIDDGDEKPPHPKGKRGEKYSRILEVDPTTKKVVWSYQGTPPSSFYSPAEGGAQLLPNGDILAAEEGGRAFEIEPATKRIVWEYFNPKFDKSGQGRSGMYRIERLPVAMVEPLLRRAPSP